jgi:hypothetical protein
MNIGKSENECLVVAKTCGCKNTGKRVTYAFVNETHALCLDKKDIIHAEIEACQRLSRYAVEQTDKTAIEKELSELRMALDLLS